MKKIKIIEKLETVCHYIGKYIDATHSIFNIRFNVLRVIPVVFHNGSNYDCHLIIKESPIKFEVKFECLRENTEKLKTSFVKIQKEIRKVDQDGNQGIIIIS